jgi:hypothetical protein
VAVTLVSQKPELCSDPLYLREERTDNLLRWDVEVKPGQNGEKALPIMYQFKIEMDRNMHLGSFMSR